ncbi:MAG: hypothetical protein RBS56_00900 [Candidatus Gracilibacteria bacterium]|jgi:hypothetical protein|nr:hypothetical protein [Candidatus Gracilibacteria bacterium]
MQDGRECPELIKNVEETDKQKSPEAEISGKTDGSGDSDVENISQGILAYMNRFHC